MAVGPGVIVARPAAPATLSADAWQRFRRNRLALAGLVVVALLVVAAVGAPWLAPADPATSTEALSFDVQPGQEMLVKSEGEPVAASRMRIWATSESQKWLKYKKTNTWLVPERDENGEHIYMADAMETFTFAFTSGKIVVDPTTLDGGVAPQRAGANLGRPGIASARTGLRHALAGGPTALSGARG